MIESRRAREGCFSEEENKGMGIVIDALYLEEWGILARSYVSEVWQVTMLLWSRDDSNICGRARVQCAFELFECVGQSLDTDAVDW